MPVALPFQTYARETANIYTVKENTDRLVADNTAPSAAGAGLVCLACRGPAMQ
jgi:hypothetical protein